MEVLERNTSYETPGSDISEATHYSKYDFVCI